MVHAERLGVICVLLEEFCEEVHARRTLFSSEFIDGYGLGLLLLMLRNTLLCEFHHIRPSCSFGPSKKVPNRS